MSEKKIYSEKDVSLLDDVVSFIRKRPDLFVGAEPTGAYLIARLTEDLLLLNAGPLRLAKGGGWYSISADRDWLMSEAGVVSFEPFYRLIPMPDSGRLYDRTEVILNALADAVITSGIDGTTWINGEAHQWELPGDIDLSLPSHKGRVVAFHFSRLTAAESSQRA